jgi:hypothetical protein
MKNNQEIEFLASFGIKLDEWGIGKWHDRHVRYLGHLGLFQIGEKDFDRWANSVEYEFELWQPKGQRQFTRFAENVVL